MIAHNALRQLIVLVATALIVGSTPAAAEERVALVIGNGAYGDLGPLPNPVNDADLMARTLRDLGFAVLLRKNLDQTGMKRAIQEFGRRLERAGRDAVGLFYYAGHGVQVRGENYLIPIGAGIERESDVDIEAVNGGWVLDQMEFARNRLNFVILDACRNNPMTRGFRSATQGLARMDAPTGTLIAYSTAPGQVAADGKGRNSPYTEALAATLKNHPGLVAEEVFRRVRVAVLTATEERQVPWEASSLTGAFYFSAAPPAPAPDENVPPVQQTNAGNRPDPEGEGDIVPARDFEVALLDTTLFTQKRTNVRALPTVESARLATLEPGVEVEVTGRLADGGWYRARLTDGSVGFIHAPLLGQTPTAPPTPKPASRHTTALAPPPPIAPRPPEIVGRWVGEYRCQQEAIGMALDITDRQGSRVGAVFEFFPLPESPSFPRGKYTMSGLFDTADGSLSLRSDRWIERPLGFQSHDLEGRLDDSGSTIKGRVLTTGCFHFTVTRK